MAFADCVRLVPTSPTKSCAIDKKWEFGDNLTFLPGDSMCFDNPILALFTYREYTVAHVKFLPKIRNLDATMWFSFLCQHRLEIADLF